MAVQAATPSSRSRGSPLLLPCDSGDKPSDIDLTADAGGTASLRERRPSVRRERGEP